MSEIIKLGDEVEDIVTGFSGIATYDLRSITGVREIGITPKADRKRKIDRSEYFDISRIKRLGDGVHVEKPDRVLGFHSGGKSGQQ